MRHRLSFRKKNQAGFTLPELVVATGIASVVGLASATIFMQAADSQKRAAGDAALVTTTELLHEYIQPIRSSASGRTCFQTLKIDTTINPTFNSAAGGQTDMAIFPDATSAALRQGSLVGNNPTFKIERLYIDDVVLATDLGVKKLYLANLYLNASQTNLQGMVMPSHTRSIGAVTLTVASDQSMLDCNIEPTLTNVELCNGLQNMFWDTFSGKCKQKVATIPATNNLQCAPGFYGPGGSNCKPIATNCATGQLATAFNFSQAMSCVTPSVPLVAPVLPAVPVVPEGAAIPVQPTAPTVAYAPPTSPSTIPAPAPAPAPAASCTDGTALGAATQNLCYSGAYSTVNVYGDNCTPPATMPPSAGAACVAQATAGYSTPNLQVTPPSALPNSISTCTCNNRAINNGEYCMYCIKNANLGYGEVDYAYGVSQCSSGNLIPVPSPTLAPSPVCNNTYGRAKYVGGVFTQYTEIP